MNLGDLGTGEMRRRLLGSGLVLRTGPFSFRIRSPLDSVREGLSALYGAVPVLPDQGFADFPVSIAPGAGLHRWWHPQARFMLDGELVFEPLPQDHGYPLLEWAMNWCISSQAHHYLILHAAVLAWGDEAVLLPAPPGSGKSTLCAALLHSGWRLLSDELALVSPADGRVWPLCRPVSLKNRSIEVIRAFAPQARFNRVSHNTAKGSVTHMAVPAEHLAQIDRPARVRWVVFPKFEADAATTLTPRSPASSLVDLAHNAFNYSVHGEQGFQLLADLVEGAACFDFRYSRLAEAMEAFRGLAMRPSAAQGAAAARSVTSTLDAAGADPTAAPRTAPGPAPETAPAPASAAAPAVAAALAPSPAPLAGLGPGQAAWPARPDGRALARLLAEPDSAPLPGDDLQWESLLAMARRAMLVSTLGCRLRASSAWSDCPAPVRQHLDNARRVGERLAHEMAEEASRAHEALSGAGLGVVVLKGGAYLAAGLPPAEGRLFADLDLMVPAADVDRAERALFGAGWIPAERDAYNDRYYRQWMHEIPPLKHVRRGSMIDLHHTVTPPTSAFNVDGRVLIDAARPLAGRPGLAVLQPVDMVLHSAVHLFAEGEFDHGLRDLWDMHRLLAHFEASEPGFWPDLLARAEALRLGVPLHHALLHAGRLFGTSVPAALRPRLAALAPPWWPRVLMAGLLATALEPSPRHQRGWHEEAQRWLLYVRSHWLRMPPRLLVPHLLRKAWMRRLPPPADAAVPGQPGHRAGAPDAALDGP